MSSTETVDYSVKYYFITAEDMQTLEQYTGDNGLATDFKYGDPQHPGLFFAPESAIAADELDFLLENDLVSYMWFKLSNQPSKLY